jgi:dGTPase
LKQFLNHNLYRHDKVRVMTDKARDTVRDLFDRYMREPAQMGPDFSGPATAANFDASRKARIVADYIAGMTDRFAIAEHERLTR